MYRSGIGFDTLLAEEAEVQKNGFKNFTEHGCCSNCGECCANLIPISESEIKAIKKYIKAHNIKQQWGAIPIPFRTAPVLDLGCPFRDGSAKKCLIYPVRPAVCRNFRCDKQVGEVLKFKEKLIIKYGVCEMRSTFFGNEK